MNRAIQIETAKSSDDAAMETKNRCGMVASLLVAPLFGVAMMIFAFCVWCTGALAQDRPPISRQAETELASPLTLIQSFISKADGERCPMSPSCSTYAHQAIKQHGIVFGWVLTCDRLLRCGRDETRLAPMVRTENGPRVKDPVSANTFWWYRP